jgi:cyclic pyranopterin phosphate synthase
MIFRFNISIGFPGQATAHNFHWNPFMKNHQLHRISNLHPIWNLNLFFDPMIMRIQNNLKILEIHGFCSQTNDSLTHVDDKGRAAMVDVGNKIVTTRTAMAQATVEVGPHILDLIDQNSLKKGDVLTTAQLAGIMAAKRTSDLIPLCHNIPLSHLNVDLKLDKHNHTVIITATARCEGGTGVEMEALTAATVSALTVYDMCKAVSHDIIITEVKLLFKTGGIRGDFIRK